MNEMTRKHNHVSHFLYLRSISHAQRSVLCRKWSEYFRFIKMPAPPSKGEVKWCVGGLLFGALVMIIVGRWLLC